MRRLLLLAIAGGAASWVAQAGIRAPFATSPARMAIGANRQAADTQRDAYFWLAPWEKMPDPMRRFGRPTTLDLRFTIQPFNRSGAVLATVFATQEGLPPTLERTKASAQWRNIGAIAARTEAEMPTALANQRALIEAWAFEKVVEYRTGNKLLDRNKPVTLAYAPPPKPLQMNWPVGYLTEVPEDQPKDESVDCGFAGDRCASVASKGGGFHFDEVQLPE